MKKFIEPILILLITGFVCLSPNWLFDHQAVFALLSPGPHTQVWHIFFFLTFLLLRLFVILILPGYLLVRLGYIFFEKCKPRKGEQ
ncbi:MAG: hypothetical protein NE334_15360 [Lentisphaeraceae bacterium]|nr:hypothetical protein [Lentisphaeraceae bacterium]